MIMGRDGEAAKVSERIVLGGEFKLLVVDCGEMRKRNVVGENLKVC
jgi:hypothetical protein